MRHLVTGGSGFLGSLIAQYLLEQGESVRVLDVLDDPKRSKDIEFVKCDILDRAGVAVSMKGIDVVHHNVALVPLTKSAGRFWDVNVIGSEIAAEEAIRAGVSAFIHMSSSAIFGIPEHCPITRETVPNPAEIYGRAKWEGERRVTALCDAAKIPLIVIRPRTILGDHRLGIFKILFDWINENRNVYVIGSGDVKFQFVHAKDLMDAYMLALKVQQPGAYNVGTNRFGTLREVLEATIRHAGRSGKVVSLPETLSVNTLRALDWLHLSPLAPWHYLTYHKAFHFDVSPTEALGWTPKYSNDEMFFEGYDWFIANRDQIAGAGGSVHKSAIKEGVLHLLRRLS